MLPLDFPGGTTVKNHPDNEDKRCEFHLRVGKMPWRRKWQPTRVFLPGKSHGWRNLVGHSLRGRKESDTTEQLHFTSYSFFPTKRQHSLYLLFRIFLIHLMICLGSCYRSVHKRSQSYCVEDFVFMSHKSFNQPPLRPHFSTLQRLSRCIYFPHVRAQLCTRVCSVCVCVCSQSCLSLCNPMDYSLPGSSVHGIFQARVLEWVAISFSILQDKSLQMELPSERIWTFKWLLIKSAKFLPYRKVLSEQFLR